LDKKVFRKQEKNLLPLYESKLTHIFNHRESTFSGISTKYMYGTRPRTNKLSLSQLKNHGEKILPRYWVDQEEVNTRIPGFWKHSWLVGFRNAISAVADSRSVRFAVIP